MARTSIHILFKTTSYSTFSGADKNSPYLKWAIQRQNNGNTWQNLNKNSTKNPHRKGIVYCSEKKNIIFYEIIMKQCK